MICIKPPALFPPSAVQQERKPPEHKDRSPQPIATSMQRIYIRNNAGSPTGSGSFFALGSPPADPVTSPGLLSNLQERIVMTDGGAVVLDSSNPGRTGLHNTGRVIQAILTLSQIDRCAHGIRTCILVGSILNLLAGKNFWKVPQKK